MNILKYTLVGVKSRNAILVECVTKTLNIRSYATKTINSIDQAVILDKFGTAGEYGRNWFIKKNT